MATARTFWNFSGPVPGAFQDSTMRVEAHAASASPATRNAASWIRLPDIPGSPFQRPVQTAFGSSEDKRRAPGRQLDFGRGDYAFGPTWRRRARIRPATLLDRLAADLEIGR